MFLFLLLSCLCAGGNKFSKCLFNGKTEFLGNCQYLFLTFVLFSFSKGILQVRFRIFHIGTNELFVSKYVKYIVTRDCCGALSILNYFCGCKSNSTFTNVHLFVCQSVSQSQKPLKQLNINHSTLPPLL